MSNYEKPTVQRVGTFRELTKIGMKDCGDGGSIYGPGDPCPVRS